MNGTLINILSWYPFPVYRDMAIKYGLPVNKYNGSIFEPLKPSTITVGGRFHDVVLHEQNDIKMFHAEGDIVLIGSLYGESYQHGFEPKIPQLDRKQTKRGRKPKTKEKKRKIKGNGRYFSSQITFVVRSRRIAGKVYKFKVFRNGVFQVPGVLDVDMKDMTEPTEILREYLNNHYPTKNITVSNLHIQMRNCKTILADCRLQILTKQLGFRLSDTIAQHKAMDIFKVEYMTDKNASKTVIKFNRPTTNNAKKKTTVKILKQKINFEGGLSLEDTTYISWWLSNFILDNYDQVIYDPKLAVIDDGSSSDEPEEEEEPETVDMPAHREDISDFKYF